MLAEPQRDANPLELPSAHGGRAAARLSRGRPAGLSAGNRGGAQSGSYPHAPAHCLGLARAQKPVIVYSFTPSSMEPAMPTVAAKRKEFHLLHQSGCFVIPNPWDIGTARYLENAGFKALATTSAGFAWSRGFGDGAVPRVLMLAHIAEISAAVDVPVQADFEGCYATEPEEAAECIQV